MLKWLRAEEDLLGKGFIRLALLEQCTQARCSAFLCTFLLLIYFNLPDSYDTSRDSILSKAYAILEMYLTKEGQGIHPESPNTATIRRCFYSDA